MRKIAALTFEFAYMESPGGQIGVRNAYRRIFEQARSNILMSKDILNRDLHIVDKNLEKVHTGNDESRRIINNSGVIGEVETFPGNNIPNDQEERNSGGKNWDEMANQQSVFNKLIKASE